MKKRLFSVCLMLTALFCLTTSAYAAADLDFSMTDVDYKDGNNKAVICVSGNFTNAGDVTGRVTSVKMHVKGTDKKGKLVANNVASFVDPGMEVEPGAVVPWTFEVANSAAGYKGTINWSVDCDLYWEYWE